MPPEASSDGKEGLDDGAILDKLRKRVKELLQQNALLYEEILSLHLVVENKDKVIEALKARKLVSVTSMPAPSSIPIGLELMKQYHELLRDILENGVIKGDRTGTGTTSVFGRQIRHDLSKGFPLLTTKKLHFKSIANELIWFLSGDTNIRWLKENGVSIWNEWATEDGELGPVYGKQWTAWPTKDGGAINQIDYVVNTLRNNPNSRRILFHGWNPEFLPDESQNPQENVRQGRMALPPCHLLYQFYVANGRLSAQLYIRSSDSFLGLPYNIASLALLTHMLAQQCDLVPHEIIVSIGDLHAYSNHIVQIQTQLARDIRPLPQLKIIRKPETIYCYRFEDFEILGYDPHPSIAAPIAI